MSFALSWIYEIQTMQLKGFALRIVCILGLLDVLDMVVEGRRRPGIVGNIREIKEWARVLLMLAYIIWLSYLDDVLWSWSLSFRIVLRGGQMIWYIYLLEQTMLRDPRYLSRLLFLGSGWEDYELLTDDDDDDDEDWSSITPNVGTPDTIRGEDGHFNAPFEYGNLIGANNFELPDMLEDVSVLHGDIQGQRTTTLMIIQVDHEAHEHREEMMLLNSDEPARRPLLPIGETYPLLLRQVRPIKGSPPTPSLIATPLLHAASVGLQAHYAPSPLRYPAIPRRRIPTEFTRGVLTVNRPVAPTESVTLRGLIDGPWPVPPTGVRQARPDPRDHRAPAEEPPFGEPLPPPPPPPSPSPSPSPSPPISRSSSPTPSLSARSDSSSTSNGSNASDSWETESNASDDEENEEDEPAVPHNLPHHVLSARYVWTIRREYFRRRHFAYQRLFRAARLVHAADPQHDRVIHLARVPRGFRVHHLPRLNRARLTVAVQNLRGRI